MMFLRHWLGNTDLSKKNFFAVFTLLYNAFAWYSMILIVMENVLQSIEIVPVAFAIFYIAAVGSSIAEAVISYKIRRLPLLYFWMVLGTASSLLPVLILGTTIESLVIIFLFLGISFGFGMPSCLAYFADHTSHGNRGSIGSLILLFANLSAFPFTLLFTTFNLKLIFLILATWRGLGLLIFVLLRSDEKNFVKTKESISFKSTFQNRSFVLYLISWLMFSLVDGFEKSILGNLIEFHFHRVFLIMQPIIASFSILIGGLLSDRIGRKRVIIYGFVSLGIAYAIIGIAPLIQISWYLYLVVDSIAAGILSIIFILVLWGDLSQSSTREIYYMVGNIPFLVRNIIPSLLISFITLVPASAAFSLASFFLFLAVLPLMYAPETLPEKKIRLRQLRGYVEKAKKVRKKYLPKSASG